jgi:hypothetical protein
MGKFFKNTSLIFAAGCFGGLFKGLVAWLFGAIGISALLGSHFAPPLTPAWIYSHVVWGGIWAWLFLLPVKDFSYFSLGVIYSLPQTLISLLVLMPNMNRGLFGLKLGYMTPLLVFFFGLIWGITTAFWLKLSKES